MASSSGSGLSFGGKVLLGAALLLAAFALINGTNLLSHGQYAKLEQHHSEVMK